MEMQAEIPQKNLIIKTNHSLLVEDNQIIQRVLKSQLQELNYQVDRVNDATSAIKKLKAYAYNLIITDLRLPDKSGTTVIQAARENALNQYTPLIVYSAQISPSDVQTYLELGADAVRIKPISYKQLRRTIQACYSACLKRKFQAYKRKRCVLETARHSS